MPESTTTPPVFVQGRLGRYQLEDFLGSGQSAVVYTGRVVESQISERVGQHVAVKLMAANLDATVRRRFFDEIDILRRLRTQLRHPSLSLVEDDIIGSWLIPDVLDHSTDGPQPFIAMTLAEGHPLDDILRHNWDKLTEVEILTIIRQLLTTLVALHEGLNRSYYDFQPRNVYWDAARRTITVIDWNLLSPEGNPDIAADLNAVTALLYRLATGTAPVSFAAARPQRWQELSLAFRALLADLLAPDAPARASARAMRERIGAALALWSQPSDQLLISAAQSAEAVKMAEEAGAKWEHTQQLAVLLDLAERRGYSPFYALVAHQLRQQLLAYEEQWSWIGRGQTLLKVGELSSALDLFAQCIRDAKLLAERVAAWRWWTVAQAAVQDPRGYEAATAAFGAALVSLSSQTTYEAHRWETTDWLTVAADLQAITWQGIAPIQQELNAYAAIQALLNQSAATLEMADDSLLATLSQRMAAARAALESLPGSLDDALRYAEDAWAWIGEGDGAAAKRRVDEGLQTIEAHCESLHRTDAAVATLQTPADAVRLLQQQPNDGYLAQKELALCPAWLADSAHDAGLAELLALLAVALPRKDAQHTVQSMRTALHLLHELHFWIGRLEAAAKAKTAAALAPAEPVTEPHTEQEDEAGEAPAGAEIVEFGAAALWQPDLLQQVMLFIAAQVQKLADQCALLPGLRVRLETLLGELATVVINSGRGSSIARYLLQLHAPQLPQLSALVSLAQRDQEAEQKLQTLNRNLQNREEQLAGLQKKVEEKRAALLTLEQRYAASHQQFDERFKRKEEELRRRHEKLEADTNRAAEANRQRHVKDLENLKTEVDKTRAELEQLKSEKQKLESQLTQLRYNLRQENPQPAGQSGGTSPKVQAVAVQTSAPPPSAVSLDELVAAAAGFSMAGRDDLLSLSAQLRIASDSAWKKFDMDRIVVARKFLTVGYLIHFAQLATLQAELHERSHHAPDANSEDQAALKAAHEELQSHLNIVKAEIERLVKKASLQ